MERIHPARDHPRRVRGGGPDTNGSVDYGGRARSGLHPDRTGEGVAETAVVFKHALPNALLPIITLFGLGFVATLGGSVVTETIFTWPGLGRMMVDSILTRDLPVTQGALLMFALMFIAVNLIVDVLYAYVDPRITYD